MYVQGSLGKALEICVVPLTSKNCLSEPDHPIVEIRKFPVRIGNDRVAAALRQETHSGVTSRWAVLVNAKRQVQYEQLDPG